MKKILYHTLSLLFASFFFASCEKESFQVTFEQGEGVTLRLRLSNNDLQSRAGEEDRNDNEYNENAIKKVDLYLYPAGGQGQALKKVSKNIDTTNEVELVTSLSNDEKESLSGKNGTTCRAYALVNYMEKAPDANTDGSTIAALKALKITADFTTTQTSFVMDGENNVTYTESNRTVTGNVNVSRAASKISLFITSVEKTVTDAAGNIWEPDYKNMDISFHNGVNKATVDVGYTATTPARPNNTLAVGDNIYESSGIRDITATLADTQTEETIYALNTSHAPFYSYSYDWANAANDDKNPIITIMVPWRKISEKDSDGKIVIIPETDRDTKTTWQTCYYQIPVNAESRNGSLAECLERNMYYQIKLHVGILGDFNPATATTIPASYYTVDWQDQSVDVDIKNYKYLVVDKNDVTVYNENEVRIGYASSDPITAEITYIRRPDYSAQKIDTTAFYGSLTSTSGLSSVAQGTKNLLSACTVSVEDNEIVLNHNIVNQSGTTGSNYDFVPYYIWIKVTMTVNVNGSNRIFTEWIRYEQYPELYIEANPNSAYKDGYTDAQANVDRNVFVNSYWSSYSDGTYSHTPCFHTNSEGGISGKYDNGTPEEDYDTFGPALGLSYSNYYNNNPNMYVIHVTSISNEDYIIGDPREKSINDEFIGESNNTIWATAPSIYPENTYRKLQYYYRTDNNDGTEDMIAPIFRIASSYSGTDLDVSSYSDDGYEVAQRRCASYQEDGYPAGRWRMPTFAEAKFICTLSYEGKIPALFATTNNVTYWCAHGAFRASSDGSVQLVDSDPVSVRCIYDEWYWGGAKIDNKKVFTWGDAERN